MFNCKGQLINNNKSNKTEITLSHKFWSNMQYIHMDPVGPSSSKPVPNEENLLIYVPDYLEKKLYPEGSNKPLKFSIRRKAK